MKSKLFYTIGLIVLGMVAFATGPAGAATVVNPACATETVFFSPGNGEDIVVPSGYTVSVFAKGLNFPTGIAFLGKAKNFKVFVLESGHGLPGRCNDETNPFFGGVTSLSNPMTPDILVFDKNGNQIAGPLGKPTASGGGFQAGGPAIDIEFEFGLQGGRLFATDSNGRGHNNSNNSSRIVTVDPNNGLVTPFISGLPSGDYGSQQIAFKDGWIYWSQGSATNSGVVGRDNFENSVEGQKDIPCQDIVLSDNTFLSGPCNGTDCSAGAKTSGYSPFNTTNPGGTVQAFTGASAPGICTGAILRARINAPNPKATIEPFSWGYRNPYGLRVPPSYLPFGGGLLVTENGEDERGARPANNAPDRLQLARKNPDGSPDYHGWPDRFGFLDSTQAVFNPIGGPGDDCAACAVGRPVLPVLDFPPQPITAPLALEPADVAVAGFDFVPYTFAQGEVEPTAALIARGGDFGFLRSNGSPEAGHDVELVNFTERGEPLRLNLQRFAYNTTGDQAFTDPGIRGINRPTNLRFGPDGCAYLVDYGAVRDVGQSDPATRFITPADSPFVQIPGTGVIWKICRQ
jgi:glucose/arabinose dehydrogenase